MKGKSTFLAKAFLMLFAMLYSFTGARADEVTIGDGTSAGYYAPIGTYYTYSFTEQLYTAEEIETAGDITSISFYYAFNAAKDFPIEVYMKKVTDENLSTSFIDIEDGDLVFDGTLSVPAEPGWVTITLDTPFAYDGLSNLLIAVNKGEVYWFSGSTWQYTAATGMTRYIQNDQNAYSPTSSMPTGGTVITNRPNIKIEITEGSVPSVAAPSSVEATDVTANSATLTWAGGTGTYNVEYKKATDTDWTTLLTGTTDLTYALTGLESETKYQVRVQSVSGSDVSAWKNASFTTPVSFPYAQDFSGGKPNNWSLYSGLLETVMAGEATLTAATYGWGVGTNNGVQDGNHAYVNIYGTSCAKWFVTPAIPVGSNAHLAFDVAYTAYSGTAAAPATDGDDDKFVVLISTDDMATWTILRQWDNADSEYVLNDFTPEGDYVSLDLAAYAGQNVIVAFYVESTVANADNNLHIDNFVVETKTACEKPTNLTITYNGGLEAIVSWESEETVFDIDVNGEVTEDVTNPTTLTGLEYATTYTVMVRAKNASGVSNWTAPKSFNTDISDDICQIQLELSDAYGDGWNGGAALKIVDVLTSLEIGSYTVTSTAGTNPVTITVNVPNNRDIQFTWVSGSYDYECGFVVTDVNGEVLLEHVGSNSSSTGTIPAAGVLLTWHVDCTVTPWRAPTDLAASEITGTSAKLSWTENSLTPATAWVVAFKADGETEFGTEVADSNPYVLTGLSPETTYIVRVRPATDEVEKWSDEISFTTVVAFPAPTDLAVAATSRTANISWTGNADSYTLRYRKVVTGAEITTNFDDSSLGEWTTIDADGDGYGWVLGSATSGVYLAEGGSLAGSGHNDSADLIVSGSFTNVTQAALNPDNYLVSPKVTLGGRISFWAKGQDANYPAEVFGVAVSTTSNTEPSAFRMVGADKTATSEWTRYTFILDEFSGEGYIAIRHYNCTDMFMLDIDDIVIAEPAVSTTPWNVVEDLDVTSYELTGLEPSTEYEVGVKAIYDTDESVWESSFFTTDIATPAPTELAAGNITSSTAEITWTADPAATGFELQYAVRPEVTGITTLFYDDGTSATNIGNSPASTWTWGVMYPGSMITATALDKVSIYESSYAEEDITIYIFQGGDTAPETLLYTETVTPEAANAFHEVIFGTPVELTAGQNLWIVLKEEGTYVMASCETTEANNQWVYGSSGWANIGDLSSSLAGYGWMIRADIGTVSGETTWTTIADATSPTELTGLTPETNYIVRVKASYGTEAESEWASTSFATLTDNPVPYDIEADLAADGATLTWTGEGESYNVRYRTEEVIETFFEEDFTGGLGDWTTVNLQSGGGANTDGYFIFKWTTTPPQYLISPELTGLTKATVLAFYYCCYNVTYPETFKVGYSTTTNDVTDETVFTWSDEVTSSSKNWELYSQALPAGVKYIAIQCTSNDQYYLYVSYIGIYANYSEEGDWQTMTVTEPTATISGLATNNAYEYQIQSVKNGATSEWSDIDDFALLSLDSDADNNSLINTFGGYLAHVTLANRTLVQNNTWNTLCLPFSLSAEELAASPLAGADFRSLEGIDVTSTSVALNFSAQGAYDDLAGSTPWIVKWEGGSGIVNPQFANVTIQEGLTDLSFSNTASGYGVTFKGTYAKKDFTTDDPSILFVGADNKLNYPLAGAKVGAFRGYFELEGFTMDEASGVKIFTNLDDEDATGIANVEKIEENTDWYDLSGRKLAGKPSVKGIYVNGGRKVTVK